MFYVFFPHFRGSKKNLENVVPPQKKIFFFKKNLKKFLKNKTKSPLKIRMFAKNRTLIEGLEKKYNFFKNRSDMSSSLGAKIKMAAIFLFWVLRTCPFACNPQFYTCLGGYS